MLEVGLTWNGFLFGPSIVTGAANAVFYALLAVPLVVCFRISRTVAFVNGGLAIAGGLIFNYLFFDSQNVTLPQPSLPGGVGYLIVAAGAAVIGGAYGLFITTKRMTEFSRITITTFSLGLMLLFGGIVVSIFQSTALEVPPSPFGAGAFHIWGGQFSHHQAYCALFLAIVVVTLTWVLGHTRFGIYIRAIADNPDASRLVGVPIRQVSTLVYAFSGAIAALAGAFVTPDFSPDVITIVFVFLRAMTVAVLGGFNSVGLALAGAMIFGMVDSMFRSGLFGNVSGGSREVIAVGLLLVGVLILNRFRQQSKELLEVEGL